MSWDVVFVAMPPGARSLAELVDAPAPLGSRAEVIGAIQAAAPTVDFHDPAWGRLDAERFSIEFAVGDDDPVVSLMLHVHGGDGALGVIAAVAQALGQPPIDCSDGTVLDVASPAAAASFAAWQAYRDRIISPDRA